MKNKNIIFAPNIHVGGGAVLLNSLMDESRGKGVRYYLDSRFKKSMCVDEGSENIYWVKGGVLGRLFSEVNLFRSSSENSKILCLNGIPPLINKKSNISVFVQNRIIVDKIDLNKYKIKTRLRIIFEKILFAFLKKKVNTFFVQTLSMKNLLLKKVDVNKQHVKIYPFGSLNVDNAVVLEKKWDFIYVADGEAHKNHLNLFLAWKALSDEGIYPTLAITLSDRDSEIKNTLDFFIKNEKIKIFDLGYVLHREICFLYKSSCALIYPSLLESFGLPLVEASMLDIPIVASELDYVRDVCVPSQTFDPTSPLSIARAVKRFMQYKDPSFCFVSPSDFLNEVFEVKNDT